MFVKLCGCDLFNFPLVSAIISYVIHSFLYLDLFSNPFTLSFTSPGIKGVAMIDSDYHKIVPFFL